VVNPKFIRMMLAGQRPTIYGEGETSRDFMHVENVIHATIAAAEEPEAGGRGFNAATGESHTLNELVEVINKPLEAQLKPICSDARPREVPESLADVGGAKEVLGYDPTVHFGAGIRRTFGPLAGSQSTRDRQAVRPAS
jgi:UDP-glucose 4-epimerase